MKKLSNITAFFSLLIILILGIWVQTHIYFNEDISWLMHAGSRLLNHGNYYSDFFEPDPPMAIFLYLPAVILSKLTYLSYINSSLIFELSLAIISLYISYHLSNQIFVKNNFQKNLFILTLAFTFILLPARYFGERENLMFILIFPYVLLAARQTPVSAKLTIIIGLMAGIGFVIKPHFLLTWFLIELFLFFKLNKKNFLSRPEIYSVIFIALSYLVAALIFTPEYSTHILPLLIKYYYIAFGTPILSILATPLVAYASVVSLFYLSLRPYMGQKNLADLLFIILLSFLIVHLSQRSIWYYHILPALSASFLLIIVIYTDLSAQNNFSNKIKLFLYILLLFPIIITANQTTLAVLAKQNSIRKDFIELIHNQCPNKAIYFISDLITPTYPIVDYTNTHSVSRFPCLWMFLSTYLAKQNITIADQLEKINQDEKFFVSLAVEDLIKNNPDLVFIQLNSPNWHQPNQIDYIKLFHQDPRFQSTWQNYRYLKNLGDYAVYQHITKYGRVD